MTKAQELERYKKALQDFAELCPYPEARKQAAAILDRDTELVRAIPRRTE